MNEAEIQEFGAALRTLEYSATGPEVDFDTGELWDLVEGKLGASRVRELADEAVRNPELAEAWHLALEIRNTRNQEFGIQHRTFHVQKWMAIAAILVVGLLSPILLHHFRSTTVYRGASTTEIQPVGEEDALIPRNHFLLRWKDPSKNVLSWDIVVMKGDLEEIFAKEGLTHPEFQVPKEALTDLKPGDRVLWQVGSTDRDGTRQVSKTFVVKLGKEQ